jgi:riboflavin synthase
VFTGIVEELGTLRGITQGSQTAQVRVAAARVLEGTQIGDSILTDGICLTVTAISAGAFTADAMPETVRRTTLAARRPGDRLNLERSLRADSLIGGHLVTGHVDGVGTVRSVEPEANALVVTISAPAEVTQLSVPRGSLAVNGVSLTIVAVGDDFVRVSLIPHTAGVTNLGVQKSGMQVNLEADLIARYVRVFLARMAGGAEDGGADLGGLGCAGAGSGEAATSLTWQKLGEAGFL